MSEQRPASESSPDGVIHRLADASRAERPRPGAKDRALAAVLPEFDVVAAVPPQAFERPRRSFTARVGSAALALCVALAGGGLYMKHNADVAAAQQAAAQRAQAAAQAELDKLVAELREQEATVARLQAALANAKDDASRAAAQRALVDAQRQADDVSLAVRRGAAAGPGKAGSQKKVCNCNPGDPLCDCIP
jgi:colicin import membrane protein